MIIYANAFVIGGILMGFEMLGSRYLYPYFGGGIGTWAGLISTVLCALTVGYFVGGPLIDKYPSPRTAGLAVTLSAAYLVCVPPTADHVMASILKTAGDGALGIILAATSLLLIPLSLLGTFSPGAIRLLSHSAVGAGRTSGFVYGVSTVGSVFGTLFTTFVLIPWIGSRAITYLYAIVLFISAVSLILTPPKEDHTDIP